LRVIKEARPAWVLGENVPGIIPMELDNVLSDLESVGYATRPFVIPACAVDARHRRDRLWIVCRDVSNAFRRGSQIGWADGNRGLERIIEEGQAPGDYLSEVTESGVLPTPTANRRDGLQSHGVNVVSGSLNPMWLEWLMGFPLGWTALEDSATPSSRKSPTKSCGKFEC